MLSNAEPLTDSPAGSTPYGDYAFTETLLSLQQPRSAAETEPAFIILSQVKELLFKLLHVEFAMARDHLNADRLDDALWTLRRAARIQRFLLSSWEVLGALSPVEFTEIREILGTASGLQSSSYRRLEFVLGKKNPAMLHQHHDSPAYKEVLEQLRQPSLYDETLALLHRRGLGVPRQVIDRDLAEPYEPSEAVEAAWHSVYREPSRYRDLYLLGEALMDAADLFARWRYTHLVTVERTLGGKPGTGGTTGIRWLRRISEHRFFPELWSVRSVL